MSKIENYLGIANHDIQTANNSQELKSYVASILCEIDELLEENQLLKKQVEEYKDKINWYENFEINKTIDKLRIKHNNQQKEFIKYLEEEISKWHYNYDSNTYEYELEEPPAEELLVSALLKYKEIIGDDK